MARKKYKKRKKQKSLIFPSLLLLILLVSVIFTSKLVFSDITNNISINKREKATIVYTNQSDEVITISSEFLLDDKLSMTSDNKYSFNINTKNNNKNYSIKIVKVNSQIEDKYIKFYLTDSKDKKLIKPTRLSDLKYDNDNLVLYNGVLKHKKEKFNLRVWVSNDFKSNEVKNFSFKVIIEN